MGPRCLAERAWPEQRHEEGRALNHLVWRLTIVASVLITVLALSGSPLVRHAAALSEPDEGAPTIAALPLAPAADGGSNASVVAEVAPAAPSSTAASEPAQDLTFGDYYIHVPAGIKDPAPVLVALHGIGGDGRSSCDGVRAWADRQGWVLVGPTFAYGDWTNPDAVAGESPRLLPRLAAILDELPERIGHPVESRVALYGFSRGAQLAERFALLYPGRVRAAVLMSAGTYTLPLPEATVDGRTRSLPYPLGVADVAGRFGRDVDLNTFRRVPFWVGVGSEDNDPNAVPAQWTPYLGNTRVERARQFAAILRGLGVSVQQTEFPGLGHEIGDSEHDQALAWITATR
jgi:predicted esterase